MSVKDFYTNPDLADGFGSTAGRRVRPHGGLDFPKPAGAPIPALFSGTVYAKGFSSSLGYYITIKSADLYVTYCHGSAASSLAIGDSVNQSDTVLFVGLTGETTGYHLHLITSTGTGYGYSTPGTRDPYPYVEIAVNGRDYGKPIAAGGTMGIKIISDPDSNNRDKYLQAEPGGIIHIANGEDLKALQNGLSGTYESFKQIKIAEAYFYALQHGYKTDLFKKF